MRAVLIGIAQAMLALRQHGCRTPYTQPNHIR